MGQKALLTTGAIAKYCQVTHRTILRWIDEGKIEAFATPGGHHRVTEDAFVRFLQAHNMPLPEAMTGVEQKIKILIVDDEKEGLDGLSRAFRAERNFQVETALNGFAAGQKLMDFEPDVVLLDICMPGMDGYEVTRSIRDHDKTARIKIIAMSGYFDQDKKKAVMACGADMCVDKPFEVKALVRSIEGLRKR